MQIRTYIPIAAAALLACDLQSGSNEEFRLAVDESVATGQAEAAEQDIVEISTSFTLGQAAQQAILGIQAFVESQAACATVTPSGDRGLRIDFGDLADDCTYKGRNYGGVLTIEVEASDGAAVVHHTAEGFTNGVVTLDGTAEVTWTAASRHVVSDLAFARDGRAFTVEGDRTQRLLDAGAGLSGGIVVDGTRDWHNDRGDFALTIEGVELRPADPIPQAGTYRLVVPSGAEVSLAFERVDADTIEVRIDGGRRDRVFRVTSAGAVSEG